MTDNRMIAAGLVLMGLAVIPLVPWLKIPTVMPLGVVAVVFLLGFSSFVFGLSSSILDPVRLS